MLINEQLANMNNDDLNQRYREAYVLYNGTPAFVMGLADGMIEYLTLEKGERNWVPFDYRLLDTSRPRSRWFGVPHRLGTRFVHLSYPQKKQYLRGLAMHNISPFWLHETCDNTTLFKHVLTEQYTLPNLVPLKAGENGVFKDHTLVEDVVDKGQFAIWFRLRRVAYYTMDGTVKIYHPKFAQEVYEACPETRQMKHLPRMEDWNNPVPMAYKKPPLKPKFKPMRPGEWRAMPGLPPEFRLPDVEEIRRMIYGNNVNPAVDLNVDDFDIRLEGPPQEEGEF